MRRLRESLSPSRCAAYGGGAAALILAACCAGALALLGITSVAVTIGAWRLDLLSDAILFPMLGASLIVTAVGYGMMHRDKMGKPR